MSIELTPRTTTTTTERSKRADDASGLCIACIHSASFPSCTQRARPFEEDIEEIEIEGARVPQLANKAAVHEFAPLVARDLFKKEGKEDGETDFGWLQLRLGALHTPRFPPE